MTGKSTLVPTEGDARHRHPRSTHLVAIITLALVALADVLFYRQSMFGWTLGGYGALVVVAMVACNWHLTQSGIGRLMLVLLAGMCLSLIQAPSALACALFVAGLISLGLAAQPAAFKHAGSYLAAVAVYLIEAGCSLVDDGLRLFSINRNAAVPGKLARAAQTWLLPTMASMVFLALFASANPILEHWLTSSFALTAFFSQLPDAGRVRLWLSVGLAVWVLARTRVRTLDPFALALASAPSGPGREAGKMKRLAEHLLPTAAVVRALILFNLLFAVQNAMDIAYLGGHVALPPGFTYASYAHRSAYPLIATALLAAAFVIVAFRPGSQAAGSRALKLGMYLWISQNVLLVASAIWRTRLYVEAYSLTYLRAAALIWMALVAFGLVLLVIRFIADLDNWWLIDANVLAALAVLYAVCFVDLGRIIADFNVAHCRELGGTGQSLDVAYLQTIGPSALPALRRYEQHRRAGPAIGHWESGATAASAISNLEADLRVRVSRWRSWTWRLNRLAQSEQASHPWHARP